MKLLHSCPLFPAGPAPAQAESSFTEELSKFGTTVKDKLLEAVDSVKKINFSEPWSGPFPGRGRTGEQRGEGRGGMDSQTEKTDKILVVTQLDLRVLRPGGQAP